VTKLVVGLFSVGSPPMQKPMREGRRGKVSNKGAHYFMPNRFYANLTMNTEVLRTKQRPKFQCHNDITFE
jgi:hypothetical protein